MLPSDNRDFPPLPFPYIDAVEFTTAILDSRTITPEPVIGLLNPPPTLPELTDQEEFFALAYIESSGNVEQAAKIVFGKEMGLPRAVGVQVLARPQVAARVAAIHTALCEGALISMGSHLNELATIRDMGKLMGDLDVALKAEVKRGEVGSLYKVAQANTTPTTAIQINMVSPHDRNI